MNIWHAEAKHLRSQVRFAHNECSESIATPVTFKGEQCQLAAADITSTQRIYYQSLEDLHFQSLLRLYADDVSGEFSVTKPGSVSISRQFLNHRQLFIAAPIVAVVLACLKVEDLERGGGGIFNFEIEVIPFMLKDTGGLLKLTRLPKVKTNCCRCASSQWVEGFYSAHCFCSAVAPENKVAFYRPKQCQK